MLLDEITDPSASTPEALRSEYIDHLARIIADVGIDHVAAETDLETAQIEAIMADDVSSLTLDTTASILALSEEWPDAETIKVEIRDTVMLRMSSAVMDVEALAREMDGSLDPTGVQQRIEGRHPMTLLEYARVVHAIARNSPG